MARQKKQTVDYFPLWKPQNVTESRFHSIDFKIRYKALRNSSSAFIKRKDVRNIIIKRNGGKCVICGNKENLQIDHIVAVWRTANKEFPIELLNTSMNLRTLCKKCNMEKLP